MIPNYQITDDTPIIMLTVGQLKEIISSTVLDVVSKSQTLEANEPSNKRYVYGIAGIATLFQVSYVTAFKMKETILKPAIFQQGRKIMCDADLAIELFRNYSSTNLI